MSFKKTQQEGLHILMQPQNLMRHGKPGVDINGAKRQAALCPVLQTPEQDRQPGLLRLYVCKPRGRETAGSNIGDIQACRYTMLR